jgi:PKD repeat protein
MNVFPRSRSLNGLRTLPMPLAMLLFFLPTILPAQTVPVSTPGIVGIITGVPPIYSGPYVLQMTEYGFFWLDTAAPLAGHVQAVSKCVSGFPPSDSGYYVLADCNTITNVSASGIYAVVRMTSGQCGAQSLGCGGSRDDGHWRFTFGLGTWDYRGDLGEIPDSTQTADPLGRTWSVRPVDLSGRNFSWQVVGGGVPTPTPTPAVGPPVARATATNLSAAARGDGTNYYGDKWQLQDTSITSSPITRIDWDFINNGSFLSDENGAPASEGTVIGYFPCDPHGVAAGTIRTGANCIQSLGLTNPPAPGGYRLAMQSENQYGPSASPFISTSFPVVCPQAGIPGYTGFSGTCVKTGGTLNVLTGGSADASASKGNLGEATFSWAFTGPAPITVEGQIVPVPAGATGFTLTITFPGGYQATASGSVVQSYLIPAFSLAPNPVLINSTLTLTNQMRKLATTTLNSVDYVINLGVCGAAPSFTGASQLASSFLSTDGTAGVAAPPSNGGYCVYLRYNFTPEGQPQQSQIVSNGFTATDWVPRPVISVSPTPFCFSSCQIQIGTTYSLSDSEIIPVSPHPGAQWDLVSSSGTTSIGFSADASTPISWTPASACGSCSLRVTVNGATQTLPVAVSPPIAPTPTPAPTPPPGGSLTVSVTGPSSGSKGVPLNFTASASGGTGSYSYSWNCDYVPSFPTFSPGGSTTTCTYSAAGVHTVVARVDSGGSSTLSAGHSVTIAGVPSPSSGYTVSGPTVSINLSGRYTADNGSPITFTANETSANSYAWDFGDGTSATTKSFVKTYTAAGSYTASLTVAGDGTNTSGTASATIPLQITGPPAPSTAYTVTGATQTGANAYAAEAGRAITFTATATQASGYVWDFGDETKSGKSATKTYSAAGARTVHLTVTGDGTNTSGTASVDIAMAVTPPSFRAAIVPGAAHLDDGTTTWGTDVSITNGGAASMSIGLAFLPLMADSVAPATLDLTQLDYGTPITLSPGASYSVSDVVAALNGGDNKGTLVIKYEPGTRAPLVSARVYFQPKVNPGNVSYGSGIPSYEVDGTGRISPQGFVSTALSQSPIGLRTESEAAALDLGLTVTPTGSGSGTVTSDPAGINCPTTCSASFPVGTFVLLTGTAAPGSSFNGFTGCDSSLYGQCGLSMLSSKAVTARFDSSGPTPTPTPGPTNFTLTVSKAGTGSGTVSSAPAGISCGATCSATFAQATAVTLTAAPASGSTFSGWSGACSGTGSCSLTMSADQSATATFTAAAAPPPPSGDQYLIGLQSDPRYRFVVTLFNAGAVQGNFELRAIDDQGALVSILDASGSLVASRKFNNLGPYQQVYLRDSDLFRESDLGLGKHYVLKATATKGTLLAFGTALDRKTLDLVQISDDSQASPAEDGIVSYWVAGVSRYDTTYGAHWRTDLRIFNRSKKPRNLSFQYSFTNDGVTEHVAEVANLSIAGEHLLTYDDVVAALLAGDKRVDLSGSNAGILRILYPEDDESATLPLIVGSRNYNDDPTGTAGSQLAVYTTAQAGSASQDLSLTGVEDSARYSSRIGVFAMDPGPVTGRIVAVAPDGSEVGSVDFTLGGSSPHYGQLSLTDPNMNFTNPGKPVSIRFEKLSGGRVGAYAFTVDKVTLDTNFIQGLPQN